MPAAREAAALLSSPPSHVKPPPSVFAMKAQQTFLLTFWLRLPPLEAAALGSTSVAVCAEEQASWCGPQKSAAPPHLDPIGSPPCSDLPSAAPRLTPPEAQK
eukprot:54320-Chlamydomonas_euryale.AAC.3